MPMNIAAIIEPSRVLRNVEARSKKHALDILSEMIAGADDELCQSKVFDSLICREKVGCTAMPGGVAIPHGCIEGLDRAIGAFVKLGEAVDYDTPDGGPVDLMFAVVLPKSDQDNNITCLKEVAELFTDEDFLSMLREAKSSRTLYDMITAHRAAQSASA
jgi:PTS system nitrogen regulatory IIA component